MKRIHTRVKLPPVRLYIEDIEALLKLIAEAGSSDSVISLEAKGYRLESTDELTQLGPGTISQLLIRSDRPDITVDLDTDEIVIISREDTPAAAGLVHQLGDALRERKRPFATILVHGASLVTLFIIGTAFFGTCYEMMTRLDSSFEMASAMGIACVPFFVLLFRGIWMRNKGHTIVVPRRRTEQLPFWETQKGKWLDRAITALITAMVSSLATYLIVQALGE